jgi:type IV secretion system protein VirB1
MMTPFYFMTVAQQCAPHVSAATMAAIVRAESSFNPFAIGVVHGRLVRQPSSVAEAVATVRALEAGGWNFSVGLAQVNRSNWTAYGLTERSAFEPCRNLAAGAAILQDCYSAALRLHPETQAALRASLSCYATGNFSSGYRTGYVQGVVEHAAAQTSSASEAVPAVKPIPVIPVNPNVSNHETRLHAIGHAPPRETQGESAPGAKEGDETSAVVF